MSPHGTAARREQRRRKAIERLGDGLSQREVAEELGVDSRSVRRWVQIAEKQGVDGLRARPVQGRPSKLSAAQKRKLVRFFQKDPKREWRRDKIAWLIEKAFGITYSPAHLSRVLRSLGFKKARRPNRSSDPDRPVDRRIKVRRYPAKADPPDTI